MQYFGSVHPHGEATKAIPVARSIRLGITSHFGSSISPLCCAGLCWANTACSLLSLYLLLSLSRREGTGREIMTNKLHGHALERAALSVQDGTMKL